jgi:hypothetical protein
MRVAEAARELEALEAELARRSLRTFVDVAWPLVEPRVPFAPNWHIDAICEHLEAVSRGEITKLLINVPPACMKSYLVSVFWPAWEWATHGGLRVFTASFGSPLAIRDNRRMRDIVTSAWYRRHYQVELREDQNQKIRYDTTASGWRIASSVGGIGMGEHPDRIIIDDPHNTRQAESDVERQAAMHWFDRTIGTRGVSRGVKLVVIMQRLHERDLSGHILERADADDWTHLCLPMRYESGRAAVPGRPGRVFVKKLGSFIVSEFRTVPLDMLAPNGDGWAWRVRDRRGAIWPSGPRIFPEARA